MNNYGQLIAPNTLQFERLLPGTVEKVWEYITDGEKRALWFAGGATDLQAGGKMQLVFMNSQFSPPDPVPEKYKEYGDGFVSEATISKCEPPHLFEIEWEGLVRFELEQVGDKVKLVLTHEKLVDNKEVRTGTLSGWHTHLDILNDRLNDQAPEKFWPKHMKLEDEYAQRID